MNSATKYAELGPEYHWTWAKQMPNGPYVRWVRQVLDHFPASGAGRQVLDVGCGDGYPASILVERGYRVYGVDPLPGPLKVAVRRVPGATFSLGYPGDEFDFVLAMDSLEHMGDPSDLVEAVMSCYEYALVSTPPPGTDPHAERSYGFQDMIDLFPRCAVELLIYDNHHQLFRLYPSKNGVA